MKNKNSKVTLIFILLLSICGYSTLSKLNQENESITYDISIKKKIKIELGFKPSTGYEWYIDYYNKSFLDSIDIKYTSSMNAKKREAGAGFSIACFIFKAKKIGLDSLVFVKKRSFTSTSIDTIKFYIKVH